jgi:hypothetical protein
VLIPEHHSGFIDWQTYEANQERRRGRHPGLHHALEPAGLAATLAAAERLEGDRGTALKQWRLGVERASYEAQRAERRYRAVDPDNRLMARGLERDWEEGLRALDAAKADLESRERPRPRVISQAERGRLLKLGRDLAAVWQAATTTPRDRKELLRTLLEEVIISSSRSSATRPRPISRCAGRAARSARSISPCRVRGRPPSALMRTPSHWCAGSRSIEKMRLIVLVPGEAGSAVTRRFYRRFRRVLAFASGGSG